MRRKILVITSLHTHALEYSDKQYESVKNAEFFNDEKVCYVILLDNNCEPLATHGNVFADVASFSLN